MTAELANHEESKTSNDCFFNKNEQHNNFHFKINQNHYNGRNMFSFLGDRLMLSSDFSHAFLGDAHKLHTCEKDFRSFVLKQL